MVGRGLYSIVDTDLIQRCRAHFDKGDVYFSNLKLLKELKYRVIDASNPPFRQLS